MPVEVLRDLRKRFGTARDQGARPTCLAFAASDAHAALRDPWSPLSCEFAFYHAQRRAGRPPTSGATLPAMLTTLKADGQPVEADWPYLDALPADLDGYGPPEKLTVFRRDGEPREDGPDEIVTRLDAGRPSLVLMMISDAFYPARRRRRRARSRGRSAGPEPTPRRRGGGPRSSRRRPRRAGAEQLGRRLGNRRPRVAPCTSAWLAASKAVYALPGHEGHHVVIDVEDPVAQSEQDAAVIATVDAFLEEHTETGFLVRTVANTIFPQATYEDHGSPEFYMVYIEKVFPRLKRSPRDWGRYFERMMAYPSPDDSVNLLADLVAKMKRHVESGSPFRNIYELPIYNPLKDAGGSPRGGQCLSYLSFKLDKDRRLLLSAVYRNHYYTEKLLGNLVGLGRLMAFVASEAKVQVGALSVLSTHAEVDAAGASRAELKALHARCAEILAAPAKAKAA